MIDLLSVECGVSIIDPQVQYADFNAFSGKALCLGAGEIDRMEVFLHGRGHQGQR